jgi:Skp family chaperone for outer membrane proteins
MEKMNLMRELFHGIPNRLNAISIISFASADVLEGAVNSRPGEKNKGEIIEKTRANMKMIDDAYRACLSDIELLKGAVLPEFENKEDAERDFEAISRDLSEISGLMEKSNKVLKDIGDEEKYDLILSLTEVLYAFENISADTAKRISALKKKLIELGRYHK